MSLHLLGQWSLSISFLFYCVYFVPQLWHNRKAEHAQGISYWLQLIFVLGYSCDWLYGAAAHMQWQYRCVTFIGLIALCYQQWQLRPTLCVGAKQPNLTGLPRRAAPRNDGRRYLLVTATVITLVALTLLLSANTALVNHLPINALGVISTLCYILAFIPQLIRNHKEKNGYALSHPFIAITLICTALDMVSALCLQWPWPSIASPPLLFALHAGCWWQQVGYRQQNKGLQVQI